jgi:hypothetical protein
VPTVWTRVAEPGSDSPGGWKGEGFAAGRLGVSQKVVQFLVPCTLTVVV